MSGIIPIAFVAQSLRRFNHLWIDASATPGAIFLDERSFDKLFQHWDRKVKRRSLSHRALSPRPALMQGNDTTNIGQTDACTLKFLLWMETLEHAEEPVDKVHVKPHAIVSDKKDIFTSILPASYLDLGAGTRACEFDGIRDEIEKYKLQQ
jgi:hypothetical protein